MKWKRVEIMKLFPTARPNCSIILKKPVGLSKPVRPEPFDKAFQSVVEGLRANGF